MTRTSLNLGFFIGVLASLSLLGGAQGAVSRAKIDITKPNRILAGGETQTALSLLALSLEKAPKKNGERIKLVWGNSVMEPWKGSPGYFHIEHRNNQQDAIVELARTTTSFADLKNIRRQLLQSQALKDVTVEVDRVTQNLVVHLKFKKPVQLSAATGKDAKLGAYLAVDFRSEARTTQKGAQKK